MLNEEDDSRVTEPGRHGLHHPASGGPASPAEATTRADSISPGQPELLWGEQSWPGPKCLPLDCRPVGGHKLSPAPALGGCLTGAHLSPNSPPRCVQLRSYKAVADPATKVLRQCRRDANRGSERFCDLPEVAQLSRENRESSPECLTPSSVLRLCSQRLNPVLPPKGPPQLLVVFKWQT